MRGRARPAASACGPSRWRELRAANDRGSAVVEFVLVAVLVLVLVTALIQLTLALHVRNTLIDAASEGARHAALVGSTPADGVARTRELIGLTVSARYAGDVSAQTVRRGGVDLVRVDVAAPLPVLGLLGPSGVVTVSGHAVVERPPAGASP